MHKNQKGIAHILILILILIALSAAAFYYLTQQKPTKPSPTQTPTTNKTNALDWETYANNIFGFNFDYPENAEILDNLPKTQAQSIPPSQNLKIAFNPDTTMSVYINPDGFGPIFADKTYYIDYTNTKGLYITKTTEEGVSKYRDDNYTVIEIPQTTRINNLGIFITFRFPNSNPEQEGIFRQILSTFRFLEVPGHSRTTEIRRSNGTIAMINLDSIQPYPESQVFDDVSQSWIEKIILSPDESKIVIVTWDGATGAYIVLLTTFDKPNDLHEIGLNNIEKLDNIVWSDDSRYVTTVSTPTEIGPYGISIWDTKTNNHASLQEPQVTLTDSCASLSLYNPKWIDNKSLEANYEPYYFYSDEDCKPSSEAAKNEEGTTILHIEQ